MHPFLFILSIIFLFSIVTVGEVKKYILSQYSEKGYESYMAERARVLKLKEKARLQEIKASSFKSDLVVEKKKKSPSKSPKKSSSRKRCYKLNFDFARPPNNSRLNLYLLLFEEEKNPVKKREEILKQLILNLYGNTSDAMQLATAWIEVMGAEKEKFTNETYPDGIVALEMPSPELRAFYYKVLKGDHENPSLLNYLTFDKKLTPTTRKINLLFASEELLGAMFDNQRIVDKILSMRKGILEEIGKAEPSLKREEIKTELCLRFERLLEDEKLSPLWMKQFDFGLGKPGNVLFHRNPITNTLDREKIL